MRLFSKQKRKENCLASTLYSLRLSTPKNHSNSFESVLTATNSNLKKLFEQFRNGKSTLVINKFVSQTHNSKALPIPKKLF